MSLDKELEIQLQFLDEAEEYLGTLEAALLGFANRGIDAAKINAALRAAHSIKGGAGMMGFQTLSGLAHRLEDSFKVLKIQKGSIDIDADLESLLLRAVDCLRQVIEWDRRRVGIDPYWLESRAEPVFNQLYDRLGEPQPEDASSILSPEEGQDVIPLLFQTEVEGCLNRLEVVLTTGQPCLQEELEILSQELGGLGEMLQLGAFTQLCESIAQHLAVAPDHVEEVAHLALQAWRRSQALVLTGNFDALPTALEGASFAAPPTDLLLEDLPLEAQSFDELSFDDLLLENLPLDELLLNDLLPDNINEALFNELEREVAAEADAALSDPIQVSDAVFDIYDEFESGEPTEPLLFTPDVLQPETLPDVELPTLKDAQPTSRQTRPTEVHATEFRVMDEPDPVAPSAEPQENTVRVPVKHLNQLNDLLGELTIERNRLDLHVKRLRSLILTMTHRVRILNRSNTELRSAYDKAAQQRRILTQPPADLPALERQENGQSHFNQQFDVLELDRYDDLHLLSQEVMETIVQIQEVTSDVELGLEDAEQTSRDLNKTAKQLQTNLSQVRMRPLSDVVDRFPKALRELSLQYGKLVEFKVHGNHTLVDRNILEALSDPLMHLLRNAFDHGIEDPETRRAAGKAEQGVIEIRASHRSNRTIITISDDGGGIALDKVRLRAQQMGLDEMLLAAASDEELLSLIFEPGFSTKSEVTTLSGRGVGMDVVRNNLKQIRGDIKVDTQTGVGTTFTVSVPFTLSVVRVLLGESNGMLLAFPTDAIEEMIMMQPEQVIVTAGNEALSWEGTLVQLIRLSEWLRFHYPRQMEGLETPPAIAAPTVLMVSQNSQTVGLQVDRCWGEQEVAIRKVEGGMPLPPGFNNCTILGDGRVVPLVNVLELLHWIASSERSTPVSESFPTQPLLPSYPLLSLQPAAPIVRVEQKPTVLVVDDSINVRRLLALTLEKAGYQVAQAKDGQDALDKLLAGLHVQAVICDIEMPRLDGYGFLAKMKSTPAFEQLPVAMLTSRSGDKHRQLAMNLGATAYFSKPYNEQTLLQTLERLVNLVPAG